MTQDMTSILNQKRWTGDEIGKALISSAIYSYQQVLAGASKPAELFPSAQLKRMVDSLTDREQLHRYNRYVGLNNWLTQYQAVANAYMQMADGRISSLMQTLDVALTIDHDNDSLGTRDSLAEMHYGFSKFTAKNPDYKDNIKQIRKQQEDLIGAYRYLKGYDTAIALIAEQIDISEFLVFQVHCERVALRAHQLDDLVSFLIEDRRDPPLEIAQVKQEQITVLDRYFPPFELEKIVIPSPVLDEAKALLQDDMRAFEKQDGLFMRLLTEWR